MVYKQNSNDSCFLHKSTLMSVCCNLTPFGLSKWVYVPRNIILKSQLTPSWCLGFSLESYACKSQIILMWLNIYLGILVRFNLKMSRHFKFPKKKSHSWKFWMCHCDNYWILCVFLLKLMANKGELFLIAMPSKHVNSLVIAYWIPLKCLRHLKLKYRNSKKQKKIKRINCAALFQSSNKHSKRI